MVASKHEARPTARRRDYKKPVLATYGQLKDLTTGGSGKASEPSSGKKPRP